MLYVEAKLWVNAVKRWKLALLMMVKNNYEMKKEWGNGLSKFFVCTFLMFSYIPYNWPTNYIIMPESIRTRIRGPEWRVIFIYYLLQYIGFSMYEIEKVLYNFTFSYISSKVEHATEINVVFLNSDWFNLRPFLAWFSFVLYR